MIVNDKNTEKFCTTDEFSKKFDEEIEKSAISALTERFAADV